MDELEQARKEINEIDDKLLKLLARRIEVVKRVGDIKKQINKPVRDPKREEELLSVLTSKAKSYNIEPSIIDKFWRLLFNVAYQLEEKQGAKR